MRHVAAEMTREGFNLPLLIGGATTSMIHTAVRIAPDYDRGPVVHVVDASRAVGVVAKLLSDSDHDAFAAEVADTYAAIRERHAGRQAVRRLRSLQEARRNRCHVDWAHYDPPAPALMGRRTFDDYDLAEISRYVDWTPFFKTWELSGRYPAILDDALVGETARTLFRDAQALLECIITEKWLTARAVVGLYPANSVGDDIELYDVNGGHETVAVFHTLRQQMEKPPGRPNYALADFVAPRESGVPDYFGAFAVTAGIGLDTVVRRFEKAGDDYHAIMAQALADRLAEALAELMHRRVRREFWAYSAEESLDNEALIAEEYQGIRPAPGYPACPDHSEKGILFDLLNVPTETGVTLTESFAMRPAASVSGYYLSHPEAAYFGVGRIGRDQAEDYAARKGIDLTTAEKWLAPVLGYQRA
jgi:5-methyltetrahydrofolate--homocysteine methyltransferase